MNTTSSNRNLQGKLEHIENIINTINWFCLATDENSVKYLMKLVQNFNQPGTLPSGIEVHKYITLTDYIQNIVGTINHEKAS